jgi:iduronate 2-sulfatase
MISKNLLFILLLALTLISCQQEKKPNIFLIYVDDLRPELGAYGNDFVKSPRIDALSRDALVFNKAYATIPVCGASRASMLSGIMPNRNRFVGYMGNAQKEVPEAITLPMHLKNSGYRTLSLGKVFHTKSDNELAWSEKPYRGPSKTGKDYVTKSNIDISEENPRNRASHYEMADTTDEAYLDGKLALKAIGELNTSLQIDSSLFLAVGFWKPHLPFTPPKKYWDLYDPATLPYPTNYFVPENAPDQSIHNFGELRSYTDIPDGTEPLDSALVLKLIHGYYASISYVDQQIGKFIHELKDQGIYDESVIILVGDHGWFLGEHTMWSKHANYKDALRTTLMIKFPKSTRKGYTDLPVGLVEIYPTLMEMVGLTIPEHVQSESFLALLDGSLEAFDQKEVYCRFEDGETLIKGKYAYTEYYNDEGEKYASMLYDHEMDAAENNNIVDEVDSEVVDRLSESLSNHMVKYQ